MSLIIDPEFKALIPPLTPEERSGLEEMIKAEGCRDALITWHGIIIDGHNRYEICTRNDIEYRIDERFFPGRDDVKIWIIKNQFSRRNLPAYVRGKLALVLKPLIAAKAKENQVKSGGAVPQKSVNPVDTQKELAKVAGVSHDTIAPDRVTLTDEMKHRLAEKVKGALDAGSKYADISKSTGVSVSQLKKMKSGPLGKDLRKSEYDAVMSLPSQKSSPEGT